MRTVRHMAVYDMGNMRPPKKKITPRYLRTGRSKRLPQRKDRCPDKYECEECVRQPDQVLGEECPRERESEFKTLGTGVNLNRRETQELQWVWTIERDYSMSDKAEEESWRP